MCPLRYLHTKTSSHSVEPSDLHTGENVKQHNQSISKVNRLSRRVFSTNLAVFHYSAASFLSTQINLCFS